MPSSFYALLGLVLISAERGDLLQTNESSENKTRLSADFSNFSLEIIDLEVTLSWQQTEDPRNNYLIVELCYDGDDCTVDYDWTRSTCDVINVSGVLKLCHLKGISPTFCGYLRVQTLHGNKGENCDCTKCSCTPLRTWLFFCVDEKSQYRAPDMEEQSIGTDHVVINANVPTLEVLCYKQEIIFEFFATKNSGERSLATPSGQVIPRTFSSKTNASLAVDYNFRCDEMQNKVMVKINELSPSTEYRLYGVYTPRGVTTHSAVNYITVMTKPNQPMLKIVLLVVAAVIVFIAISMTSRFTYVKVKQFKMTIQEVPEPFKKIAQQERLATKEERGAISRFLRDLSEEVVPEIAEKFNVKDFVVVAKPSCNDPAAHKEGVMTQNYVDQVPNYVITESSFPSTSGYSTQWSGYWGSQTEASEVTSREQTQYTKLLDNTYVDPEKIMKQTNDFLPETHHESLRKSHIVAGSSESFQTTWNGIPDPDAHKAKVAPVSSTHHGGNPSSHDDDIGRNTGFGSPEHESCEVTRRTSLQESSLPSGVFDNATVEQAPLNQTYVAIHSGDPSLMKGPQLPVSPYVCSVALTGKVPSNNFTPTQYNEGWGGDYKTKDDFA